MRLILNWEKTPEPWSSSSGRILTQEVGVRILEHFFTYIVAKNVMLVRSDQNKR